jgi:hypothetical protein
MGQFWTTGGERRGRPAATVLAHGNPLAFTHPMNVLALTIFVGAILAPAYECGDFRVRRQYDVRRHLLFHPAAGEYSEASPR